MRIFTKKLSFMALCSSVAISGFLAFLPVFSSRNYEKFVLNSSTSVEKQVNVSQKTEKVSKVFVSDVRVKDD